MATEIRNQAGELQQRYDVAAASRKVLIQAGDRDSLLRGACRVIVREGGLRMAWAGLVEPGTEVVRPVAWAGFERGYLAVIGAHRPQPGRPGGVRLDHPVESRSPSATAIRRGRHVVANDIAADAAMGPWREEALGRGYRSVAALPLRERGTPVGVLAAYATRRGFFDATQLAVLDDLAEDISFGLTRLRDAAQLRESQEMYRLLTETSQDMVLVHELQGRITYANRRALATIGWTDDDLRSRDIADLLTPEALPAMLERRRLRAAGTRRSFRYEAVFRVAGDRLIPFDVSSSPIVRGGRVTGILVTARDISKRLRAEQTVRLQADQRETMLATTPDGFWRFDTDGRLLEVNDAYCRMSGYTRAELLRMRIPELEAVESQSEVVDHIRKVVTSGFDRFESRHRRKGGSVFDVEISVSFWPLTGHLLLFARDISERKHSEAALARLQADLERRVADRTSQLTAANEELEAFNYSVSHDLRTPLRAISGFGDALLEDCSDALGPGGRDYVQRMRAAAAGMSQQIDALLHVSGVGRGDLRRQTVDLRSLAGEVFAELRRSAPGRRVSLRLPRTLDAEGDPTLLRMVMENLLGNAWKFTSHRASAHIEVGTTTGDRGLAYFVRDDGVGFDMEHADQLFMPFRRLHPAEDFPGAGIGLAVVRRIVHRHGGRIWAEGAAGQGATFYFSLGEAPVENRRRR